MLTGAEVDQVAGLLHLARTRSRLRSSPPRRLWRRSRANPIFGVFGRRRRDPHARSRRTSRFALPGGLTAELFTVPGKVPLYLEDGEPPRIDDETGANVGVEIACGPRAAGLRAGRRRA